VLFLGFGTSIVAGSLTLGIMTMPVVISTAEEAKAVVSYMKYVPQGIRGCALGLAHDDYRLGPVDEKLKAANDKTSLVALIESVEGIENINEIAAVNGLDCLWIGHFDLSCSLGIPGQFDHPDFISAVDRVVAAGKAHNKPLGRLVPTVETGVSLFKKGFDMILYSTDVGLLRQVLTQGVEALKSQCKA
jgi:2-dehydro-3-deoxyglucarate aldolase/4-hydroxy-2-oxoheptanedioate aldolase